MYSINEQEEMLCTITTQYKIISTNLLKYNLTDEDKLYSKIDLEIYGRSVFNFKSEFDGTEYNKIYNLLYQLDSCFEKGISNAKKFKSSINDSLKFSLKDIIRELIIRFLGETKLEDINIETEKIEQIEEILGINNKEIGKINKLVKKILKKQAV